MKKIIVRLALLLAVIIIIVGYQYARPILTSDEAISIATKHMDTVNNKMNLSYKTNNIESSWVNKDTFWNIATGNRKWSVSIDGVGININAYTGEFIDMIFPLDGVIAKDDYPDWFVK
ncbi:MAG: hypothetical protein K0Q73_4810 [Paenibacillus sp.]|jgi:hypothetical protein|nr:hypothetical protein [Paenibacillus sp.]